MRTILDRIRHVITFQVFGMAIVIPGTAVVFQQPIQHMGTVGVVSATVATAWNFSYNLIFDRLSLRFRGSTAKTVPIRLLHTILFEVGLIASLVPFIAWYLEISIAAALVMDIAIIGFYLIYAFVFNSLYDRVFPIHDEPMQCVGSEARGNR